MLVDYKSIVIPENRQRRLFAPEALEELANSIASTKGLMHAPVIRMADGVPTLVAGERRYRAIGSLLEQGRSFSYDGEVVPPGQMPVTRLSDLSDIEIMEAELEENVIRVDLSWQERAAAYAALHTLRGSQAEEAGTKQTFQSTASEILGIPSAAGTQITTVKKAIVLAAHLDDPEIAKAKSQAEAEKILRSRATSVHRAELAAKFDLAKTPQTIIHADFKDVTFSPGTFDAYVIDPPYGVGANDFSDQATTKHQYEDTWEHAAKIYQALAQKTFDAAKTQAHAYIFCDITHFFEVKTFFEIAGWSVWEKPLIWVKNLGMLPQPKHGPRQVYEVILFANKGKKETVKVGNDVMVVNLEREREHGAQKPPALYIELLSRSCLPGASVADFCCGSGTIFPAANALKLVATGCEVFENYYNQAKSRLDEQAKLEI